jgi:hypothetical protein
MCHIIEELCGDGGRFSLNLGYRYFVGRAKINDGSFEGIARVSFDFVCFSPLLMDFCRHLCSGTFRPSELGRFVSPLQKESAGRLHDHLGGDLLFGSLTGHRQCAIADDVD